MSMMITPKTGIAMVRPVRVGEAIVDGDGMMEGGEQRECGSNMAVAEFPSLTGQSNPKKDRVVVSGLMNNKTGRS